MEEDLGNNLYREYIGAEILQRARRLLAEASGIEERDLNNEAVIFSDPNLKFVKFDLEYVYYKKLSGKNSDSGNSKIGIIEPNKN